MGEEWDENEIRDLGFLMGIGKNWLKYMYFKLLYKCWVESVSQVEKFTKSNLTQP